MSEAKQGRYELIQVTCAEIIFTILQMKHFENMRKPVKVEHGCQPLSLGRVTFSPLGTTLVLQKLPDKEMGERGDSDNSRRYMETIIDRETKMDNVWDDNILIKRMRKPIWIVNVMMPQF